MASQVRVLPPPPSSPAFRVSPIEYQKCPPIAGFSYVEILLRPSLLAKNAEFGRLSLPLKIPLLGIPETGSKTGCLSRDAYFSLGQDKAIVDPTISFRLLNGLLIIKWICGTSDRFDPQGVR
jgi:hypothetical protein